MLDQKDLKYAVILLASFSVMIVAIGALLFFAIAPMQADIAGLRGEAKTFISRKEMNDNIHFVQESFAVTRGQLNTRVDSLREDLNGRIHTIQGILDQAQENTRCGKK